MSSGVKRPAEIQNLPHGQEKFFSNRGRDLRKIRTEKMPRRRWQVNEMQDIHHEIARRILLGQNNKFIAEQVGCTPQTISNVRNSPVVQERISLMRASRDNKTLDVASHIQKIAPKSIQLLEHVISGTGPGADAPLALRVKCAESNLDRAGYGAVKKFQGAVGHFTAEDVERLKQEALKRVSPVQAQDKNNETVVDA